MISPMSQLSVLQIRTNTSVVTLSFFPSFAKVLELIPAAIRNSVLFMFLSIKSFHNLL